MATKISILTHFRLEVGSVRDAVCLLGQLYQWLLMLSDYSFIKATALLILTWLFRICMVARQHQKNAKLPNFKCKFYFEKKNEPISIIYTSNNTHSDKAI